MGSRKRPWTIHPQSWYFKVLVYHYHFPCPDIPFTCIAILARDDYHGTQFLLTSLTDGSPL